MSWRAHVRRAVAQVSGEVAAGVPNGTVLDRITDLYFGGDMEASVANTGQVSARISEVMPVADVIAEMWAGCTAALDAARDRLAHAGR